MKKEIKTISEQYELVSQELNDQVLAVISNHAEGFQKAFVMAMALQTLKEKLTPEIMKPIMALQGSSLGFRTDRDGKGGYSMEEVKTALIDGVLLGLQPTNNEINIIGGQMYPTRTGFGSLLEKINGLKYNLTYTTPTVSPDQKNANCIVTIDWELNGEKNSQKIDFPIKSNTYASMDALIGKAERKARRWLFNKVKGTDVPDGDVQDIPHVEVPGNHKQISKNKEYDRIVAHIEKSTDNKMLGQVRKAIKDDDEELMIAFVQKYIELSKTVTELEKCKPAIGAEDNDTYILYDDKHKELSKNG